MNPFRELLATRPFAVLVSPPRHDPSYVTAAVEGGAHALKVHCNVEHRASGNRFGSWEEELPAIREMVAAAAGRPVGLMPGAETTVTPDELDAAVALGLSFFDVYDRHCPSWMLDHPIASMVALGTDFTAERAAALQGLGVDALEASIVEPAAYGSPLLVRDLTDYALLAAATDIPVIVPSQKMLVPGDVARLRHVGVRGVMLGTIVLGADPALVAERLRPFVDAAEGA